MTEFDTKNSSYSLISGMNRYFENKVETSTNATEYDDDNEETEFYGSHRLHEDEASTENTRRVDTGRQIQEVPSLPLPNAKKQKKSASKCAALGDKKRKNEEDIEAPALISQRAENMMVIFSFFGSRKLFKLKENLQTY